MRILEGTHDLLEEVKYAIEQKLNLSDYSDMVRPVVLNYGYANLSSCWIER